MDLVDAFVDAIISKNYSFLHFLEDSTGPDNVNEVLDDIIDRGVSELSDHRTKIKEQILKKLNRR